MEPAEGTHYQLLGIEPRATAEQVERAYQFSLEMYEDGALATYSLLDAREATEARSRIREAYEVLRDPLRRREYDQGLGLTVPGPPVLPFPAPVAAQELPPAAPEGARPRFAGRFERHVLPEPVKGADLRRFREERGVSLRDIADRSKIGVRFLEYIEADRHSHLPASVYLRGFLQEYAKSVGLDPQRTADSYMKKLPGET